MPCQDSTGQIVIIVYQLLKEPQFIEIIDQYVDRSVFNGIISILYTIP